MNNSKVKNRIIRLLALLIVALVVLFSFTACMKEKETTEPQKYYAISDLDGKRIGIAIGSMHEDIVKRYLPSSSSSIHFYNSTADLAAALNSGVIDAIICDGAVSVAIVDENKNFRIIGNPLSTDEYNFGARLIIKVSDAEITTFKDNIYNTFVAEGRLYMFLKGIETTVIISLSSIILGALLGFLYVSYCWSKPNSNLGTKIATAFVWIVKATPILVFLMILYYIIFAKTSLSGVTISIIGFTISFMASFESTLYRALMELNSGEEEAAISLGYTTWEIYFKIIVPQMFENASNDIKNDVVSLVQATSIVGYIAVQDLTKVSDIIRGRTFDALFPLLATTIIYFLICAFIIHIIKVIEVNNDPRRRTPDEILKGVKRR